MSSGTGFSFAGGTPNLDATSFRRDPAYGFSPIARIDALVGESPLMPIPKPWHDVMDRLINDRSETRRLPASIFIKRLGWFPTGTHKWLPAIEQARHAALKNCEEVVTASSVV